MKRYEELHLELTQIQDVITTSGNVTTGGIQLPWGQNDKQYQTLYDVGCYPAPIEAKYEI